MSCCHTDPKQRSADECRLQHRHATLCGEMQGGVLRTQRTRNFVERHAQRRNPTLHQKQGLSRLRSAHLGIKAVSSSDVKWDKSWGGQVLATSPDNRSWRQVLYQVKSCIKYRERMSDAIADMDAKQPTGAGEAPASPL